MRRVAVYAGTRNIYHQMAVAARSLTAHTRMDRVVFLIEDDEFPERLPSYFDTINVSGQQYFTPASPNYQSHWTWMTLMRTVIPYLLPDEERALYLDVDTICVADIGELFDEDLGEYYMAGVREPGQSTPTRMYVNAGVLLMDLKSLRESPLVDRMVFMLEHQDVRLKDQDAINAICQGRIKPISAIYNRCRFTDTPLDAKIWHFAADRGYTNHDFYKIYEKMGWEV